MQAAPLRDSNERLVVCLGASIVRGQISANFIDILTQRMSEAGFKFVNSGVAGDQSYNVLMRLDPIIDLQPDFVFILVGTNDITATLNTRMAQISRRTKKLPQPPSSRFYRQNMTAMVHALKKKTTAKIALISLPVLGEDLNSLANKRTRAYNAFLKEIAEREKIEYLPVNEKQEKFLKKELHGTGRPYETNGLLSIQLLARRYLLRQGLDDISEKNGFLLSTDGIHMNSRGAAFIVDEIESFLLANS